MMALLGVISAPIPTHPSRPRRKRSAVRRWPGQSRRLSATTRRARRPRRAALSSPRRGNVRFPCQFPLSPERFPHRVGADLCVRPRMGPVKNRVRADTQVGPYRSYCSLHQPWKTGRGRSPAPTGRSRCAAGADVPKAGSRLRRKGPSHFSPPRVRGEGFLSRKQRANRVRPCRGRTLFAPRRSAKPLRHCRRGFGHDRNGKRSTGRGDGRGGDGVPARDQ